MELVIIFLLLMLIFFNLILLQLVFKLEQKINVLSISQEEFFSKVIKGSVQNCELAKITSSSTSIDSVNTELLVITNSYSSLFIYGTSFLLLVGFGLYYQQTLLQGAASLLPSSLTFGQLGTAAKDAGSPEVHSATGTSEGFLEIPEELLLTSDELFRTILKTTGVF